MVERVGVEVEPRPALGEGAFDRAVEQPGADAPADMAERQAEEDQFLVAQLEVADEVAALARDVQLVIGLVEQGLEVCLSKELALVPQPWPADAVVEI